ncbi:hypothetical protein [Halobacteriovorax sp. JY17]|uniref:hypothetical protein n=1 Tax=Halobacteriovorax sp. JY17 TaxID=2014617 RepID=UPI000C648380|nr:hypothetical protein [Halobacteriovorax sp. JY17]PIK15897.1 MAG: hypothetical protein CES88_04000 [Halobacteriovorax sp. JY17]
MDILTVFNDPSNQSVQIVFLALAVFRLYLEVVGFKFENLPITAKMGNGKGFHRTGLYFSIGYIVFTAPGFLLA